MTETRAEKAQRLVAEGRVEVTFSDEFYVYGRVRAERLSYYVMLYRITDHFHCGCKWGKRHSYTDDLCAHALAVRLAVEKEG